MASLLLNIRIITFRQETISHTTNDGVCVFVENTKMCYNDDNMIIIMLTMNTKTSLNNPNK